MTPLSGAAQQPAGDIALTVQQRPREPHERPRQVPLLIARARTASSAAGSPAARSAATARSSPPSRSRAPSSPASLSSAIRTLDHLLETLVAQHSPCVLCVAISALWRP